MAPSATKSSFPSFKSSFGDYTLPTSVPKSGNKVPLPEGFPQEIKSSLVWHGLDLDEEEYLRVLTPDDIIEIKNAVKRFCELNIPNYQITPGTFRLPTLGPKILEWKKSLYTGRGLLIIRGIDPSQFTGPENVIVTAGIGCYIGQKRGLQYANGPVLTHVIDLTKDDRFSKEVYIGSPNQNKAMAFHNDEGHILSLYVVHAAQNGGNQKFASSWQVYNALAQQNPEIIKTLCEDWVWDTQALPVHTQNQ